MAATDIERLIKHRKDASRWTYSEPDFWVRSVTISPGKIWINGVEVPWYVTEEGPTLEWTDETSNGFKIGVLNLPLIVTNDDTIFTDTRPGEPAFADAKAAKGDAR